MDIDVTYIFQFGLFLVVLVSLNGMILKPLLRVIEERERQIDGAQQEVERLRREGDANMETYQTRMRGARVEAHREGKSSRMRDVRRSVSCWRRHAKRCRPS
ncbi:MAG: ATP synthase F0 subunit B [Myxococcota bacterium]